MRNKVFLLLVAVMSMLCASAQAPVSVKWIMGKNNAQQGWYSSKFVITNVSGAQLDSNWELFFSQFSRSFKLTPQSRVNMEEVSTTYYRVVPNERYAPLAAGDTITVDMLMRGTMVNICYAPQGCHIVLKGDRGNPIPVNIEVEELATPGQWINRTDYPDGNRMWALNESLAQGEPNADLAMYDIFPTPKQVNLTGGEMRLSGLMTLKKPLFNRGAKRAVAFLTEQLANHGIYFIAGQKQTVRLNIDKSIGSGNAEAYRLIVDNGNISIAAPTDDGLINGVKTLVAALDHSQGNVLANAVIDDEPDFDYRGFMLDIARNFTDFNNLKRFIDLLSYYKINRFQFHFTDDEAWRLEIPGLPELTEVASRRGCTLDEVGYLAQIFDGNGNPDDFHQSANGYITRAQMVELLRYAHARGVKIIPEIETPGHARAAKVAMKNRYLRLKDTDMEEALRYKLWDDNDQSVFTSAQSYHDNVLNVAEEGVYNFLQKVIIEIEQMYRDAGLKLDVLHLGGDEVAKGSWDRTPDVQSLMQREGFTSAHQVNEYFIRRMTDFLYPRGICIEGWQEVALDHSADWNKEMMPRFAGVNAWSTLGRNAVVPYNLANDGYPVILSNVTNFYIDMAYSWHQYEKGLHWGGAVDEYASWSAQPWNIYATSRTDYDGNPLDLSKVAQGKPALKHPKNIIGVQGQMWAETIRDFNQVQIYALPKIMGLTERAWNSRPQWADNDEITYLKARADYNYKIGVTELPILKRKGYVFHLGQPGIVVKEGMLYANSQYPGEIIRYTLDGSEPTLLSPEWTEPVSVGNVQVIKAKAFYLGMESVTTYLWQ